MSTPTPAIDPVHEVVVAGGGIGGLTLAIALGRLGIEALVLEQADRLRLGGAGITIQTNAMSVMQELGLAEALAREGQPLREGAILTREGRVLQAMDLGSGRPPGIAIHRERLLACLAEANPAPVRLGARVVGLEPRYDDVAVALADGSTIRGRVLVGCDGLHSDVRRALRGEEPLRYAGYTSWRGVCHGVEVAVAGTQEIWGTGGERFGIVPIGHGEVYWFAVADAPAGEDDGPSPAAELQERFADWPTPVQSLLAATRDEEIIRTDVFDRPPIDRWTDGRVALLGDAAHPMTPNLGQGAGQAIEDALALARALAGRPEDPVAALRAYEACRRDRANWFVSRSRSLGEMAQWKSPLARAMRDAALRLTPSFVVRRSVERMYSPRIDP